MDAPVIANEKTADEWTVARASRGRARMMWRRPGLAGLVSPEAVDRMLADAELAGVPLDGAGGLIGQLTRTVLERALGAELDDHLGYVQGDQAGNGSGILQRPVRQDGDHGGRAGADRGAPGPERLVRARGSCGRAGGGPGRVESFV